MRFLTLLSRAQCRRTIWRSWSGWSRRRGRRWPGRRFATSKNYILFSVADPGCVSIPVPGSRVKKTPIPDPDPHQKLMLSSWEYDPECSSRIRIWIFSASWIPNPGVKKAQKAQDPGSGSSATTAFFNTFYYLPYPGPAGVKSWFIPIVFLILIQNFRTYGLRIRSVSQDEITFCTGTVHVWICW